MSTDMHRKHTPVLKQGTNMAILCRKCKDMFLLLISTLIRKCFHVKIV